MSKKKAHHEEHIDETWLIPYADMLTLLLALFIVMFAMGQIDQEKLRSLSEQFNIIFSGGEGVLEQDGISVIPMQNVSAQDNSGKTDEEDKMNEIKRNLEQEIENRGYSDKVKVTLNREGLQITIQDGVLFNSGEAEILEKVFPLLIHITGMLKNLDNSIKVVGHTDNVPIRTQKFRSNWDLSAMRAINVMNFMIEEGKLNPNKLSIQAYGEYMPKYDNSTEVGRAQNRRVEIFIVRNYPLEDN